MLGYDLVSLENTERRRRYQTKEVELNITQLVKEKKDYLETITLYQSNYK